jgi:ferric-dicitrate binding protein FerR (iron transport regulator)
VRDSRRLEAEDEELISGYLAGDLDAGDRQRAEEILAASDEARALAARLQALDGVLVTSGPEPDPAARARVGARLEEQARRLRGRRRLVAGIGVGAALAAVAALLVAPARPRPTGIRPGVVRTGPGEYKLLELGDRAVAFAGESAELEVREGTPRLIVQRGSVRLVVRPSRSEPPFVVASPAAELAVLGTEFDVSVTGDVTEVRVTRGEVEVRNAHGRRRVWADETARVRADQSPRFFEPLRAIVLDGPAEIEEPSPPRRRR